MVRSEAQKKAHMKYRDNAEKYEIVKSINRKSNKKRYAEDEEFRNKMKAKQKERYQIRKEKKRQEKELFDKLKESEISDESKEIVVSEEEEDII